MQLHQKPVTALLQGQYQAIVQNFALPRQQSLLLGRLAPHAPQLQLKLLLTLQPATAAVWSLLAAAAAACCWHCMGWPMQR